MSYLGKLLIITGIVICFIGILLFWHEKIPWLGKLPGDVVIKGKNHTFYFPITSCLLISLFVSLLLFLINKMR